MHANARRAGVAAGAAVAAALVGLVARLVIGPAHPGYDAAYALLWGRDLADGRLPALDAPVAPTPHPLTNLVGALLAPLGADGGLTALAALSWVALGAVAVAAFALGRAVAGPVVGAVFAVLLTTRPLVLAEVGVASLDVPFLALVLAAATAAVSRPDRPQAALWWLLPAGLLRPEAWLLSAVWLLASSDGRPRPRHIAIAALAPCLWALADLAVTGDALFSLTGTRALADQLDRPQSATSAAGVIGLAIRTTLGTAVFAAGLAGLVLATRDPRPRLRVPFGLLVAGTVAFLLYGLAGLPVLARYTLVPSAALMLFAALAIAGWVGRHPRHGRRRAQAVLGALLAVLVAVSVPATAREVGERADRLELRQASFDALRELVRSPPLRRDVEGCGTVLVPNHRAVPLAALWLDRTVPGEVRSQQLGAPRRGLAILPATELIAGAAILDPRDPVPTPRQPPVGWGFRGGNVAWAWYRAC